MTSELDFVAALDAEPGNHWLRQLYADWLEENGSELASGYRTLGLLKIRAVRSPVSGRWVWGRADNDSQDSAGWPWRECLLPVAWFKKMRQIGDYDHWWWWFDETRTVAEDAAALAYLRLTDAERAKIMAGVLR